MTLKWSHLIGCSNKLPQPAALHANIYPTQASAVSVCTLQSTRAWFFLRPMPERSAQHLSGQLLLYQFCQFVRLSVCNVAGFCEDG